MWIKREMFGRMCLVSFAYGWKNQCIIVCVDSETCELVREIEMTTM